MADSDHDDPAPSYVPPEYVSVEEILRKDESDPALSKYKAALLGEAPVATVIDSKDSRVVIMKSITLLVEGREDLVMDLSNPVECHNSAFRLCEGAFYKLRFSFYVQREIVTGLRCVHKFYLLGIRVNTEKIMIGSYAPKSELQSHTTTQEEAPSGRMHRGTYKVKSQLTDDDGNIWMSWEWQLTVAKEWK